MTHEASYAHSRQRLTERQQLTEQAIAQDLLNALLLPSEMMRLNSSLSHPETEITIGEEAGNIQIPYPWNPADPDSEAFFNSLEGEFSLDEVSETALTEGSQAFFAHLDQLFSAATLQTLQTRLARKFSTVPQSLLDAVAQQAQQVKQTSDLLADQLVQCVQTILPAWGAEDLQVLARPLAYAMRGEDAASHHRAVNWEQLTEVEQARLSLAIAHYALNAIDSGAE